MIIPSDALLSRVGCLKSIDNQGKISYFRDYNAAFIKEANLKSTIASVEQFFSDANYPLENLEQQLKSLDNNSAMEEIDSIAKDAKTLLMNTARPDFVVELDYQAEQDPTTRDPKLVLSYQLVCLDVCTNKAIGSISRSNIGVVENEGSFGGLLNDDLKKSFPDFKKQIQKRFSDEINNGTEIVLRITTDNNANLKLSDECLGNVNYNDWINDWLKKNTVNSTYKPVSNTDNELRFTNVRIKTKGNDGLKFTAYDFANQLKADISKACGIKSQNKSQGIGEAYIVVSGLR